MKQTISCCLRFIILVCASIGMTELEAAVITAANAGASAVQTAVDSASAGDTVQVPAGNVTWNSSVTVAKQITVVGAGIDSTTITMSSNNLELNNTSGGIVTVSGFTFKSTTSLQYGPVQCYGNMTVNFRITNCKIYVNPTTITTSFRGISTIDTYGLIDHCTFINTSANGQGVTIDTGGSQMMISNYHTPQSLGDTNTVVIEDCVFDFVDLGDGALDAYPGTKFVFRNNLVTNTIVGWHGKDSSTRSCRLFEIYNNKFFTTGSIQPYTTLRARGGTGVVWSNTVSGAFKDFLVLSHYRADPAYSDPPGASYDGNFNLSYSGQGYPTGYPLLDQVGRGSFPSAGVPNCTSGCTTNTYEALDPMYQWGNNYKGDTAPLASVGNPSQSATYIVAGRDYYDNTSRPGYIKLAYPHPLIASDTNAPTLVSASIGSGGNTLTMSFSKPVRIGSGGSGGWSLTMTGGGVSLAYSNGSGTSTLVYSTSRPILPGETVSLGLNYTQPANGIEDSSGNDLASFTGASVTNNSTYGTATGSGSVKGKSNLRGNGRIK